MKMPKTKNTDPFPKYSHAIRLRNASFDWLYTVTADRPLTGADKKTIINAVRKTHPGNETASFRPEDVVSVSVMAAPSAVDAIAVPSGMELDGEPFLLYIPPEGAVRITLDRIDRNSTPEQTYPNDFLVPSNIYNMDCDGSAVKRLFAQILCEYASRDPKRNRPTWHGIVGVPNRFMRKYGVCQLDDPQVVMVLAVDGGGDPLQETWPDV